MALDKPMELLELAPGETRAFTVVRAELGETIITPRDGRPPKTVEDLRLHVDPNDKPLFPHYYDVTAVTLIAQLRDLAQPGAPLPRQLTIAKVGSGPAARFSVQSAPAEVRAGP